MPLQTADAVAAGVTPGTEFGDPRVAGATTTTVTAATPSGWRTVAVAALHEAPVDDADLTAAQRASRAELRAFVDRFSFSSAAITACWRVVPLRQPSGPACK